MEPSNNPADNNGFHTHSFSTLVYNHMEHRHVIVRAPATRVADDSHVDDIRNQTHDTCCPKESGVAKLQRKKCSAGCPVCPNRWSAGRQSHLEASFSHLELHDMMRSSEHQTSPPR